MACVITNRTGGLKRQGCTPLPTFAGAKEAGRRRENRSRCGRENRRVIRASRQTGSVRMRTSSHYGVVIIPYRNCPCLHFPLPASVRSVMKEDVAQRRIRIILSGTNTMVQSTFGVFHCQESVRVLCVIFFHIPRPPETTGIVGLHGISDSSYPRKQHRIRLRTRVAFNTAENLIHGQR